MRLAKIRKKMRRRKIEGRIIDGRNSKAEG